MDSNSPFWNKTSRINPYPYPNRLDSNNPFWSIKNYLMDSIQYDPFDLKNSSNSSINTIFMDEYPSSPSTNKKNLNLIIFSLKN